MPFVIEFEQLTSLVKDLGLKREWKETFAQDLTQLRAKDHGQFCQAFEDCFLRHPEVNNQITALIKDSLKMHFSGRTAQSPWGFLIDLLRQYMIWRYPESDSEPESLSSIREMLSQFVRPSTSSGQVPDEETKIGLIKKSRHQLIQLAVPECRSDLVTYFLTPIQSHSLRTSWREVFQPHPTELKEDEQTPFCERFESCFLKDIEIRGQLLQFFTTEDFPKKKLEIHGVLRLNFLCDSLKHYLETRFNNDEFYNEARAKVPVASDNSTPDLRAKAQFFLSCYLKHAEETSPEVQRGHSQFFLKDPTLLALSQEKVSTSSRLSESPSLPLVTEEHQQRRLSMFARYCPCVSSTPGRMSDTILPDGNRYHRLD